VSGRRILVVDDEHGIRSLCGDVLRRAGYTVETAETGNAGVAAVLGGRGAGRRFDLVFCDINLPDIDGLTVLERVLAGDEPPTVILITAFPSVDTAVRGMKLGARDYLTKPFGPDELRMVARRALDEDALRRQNEELRDELGWSNLIGRSPAMGDLRSTIAKVTRSEATVLVTGESGTGKELVARAIHYGGERAGKPFIAVNCGALVGSLLESELFGHVRGAFTGADTAKRGLFVAAHRGTLFLDEIGEMDLPLQPVLLRALQNGEVKPVGGIESERVDVRVIAATNRDLRRQVEEGRFREDLFYRLHVVAIEVPPLRSRPTDVPLLAEHFAERAALRHGSPRPEITTAALEWLSGQPWPGNVRELENAVERAVVLAGRPLLDVEDFAPRRPLQPIATPGVGAAGGDELCSLEELERRHVLRVLESCGGQKTRAAAVLGINRTTLWKKLRQYGLE
jgi:DNA-binding NtrC family response regulator